MSGLWHLESDRLGHGDVMVHVSRAVELRDKGMLPGGKGAELNEPNKSNRIK